jgi:hypothetical protein
MDWTAKIWDTPKIKGPGPTAASLRGPVRSSALTTRRRCDQATDRDALLSKVPPALSPIPGGGAAGREPCRHLRGQRAVRPGDDVGVRPASRRTKGGGGAGSHDSSVARGGQRDSDGGRSDRGQPGRNGREDSSGATQGAASRGPRLRRPAFSALFIGDVFETPMRRAIIKTHRGRSGFTSAYLAGNRDYNWVVPAAPVHTSAVSATARAPDTEVPAVTSSAGIEPEDAGVRGKCSSTIRPPPDALYALAVPPWSAMTLAVIASPRPVPPLSRSLDSSTR